MTDLQLELWLINVVTLFSDTLGAICRVPVLRLFLAALLFLVVFSLLAHLIRQGRKGKL